MNSCGFRDLSVPFVTLAIRRANKKDLAHLRHRLEHPGR
jgi:hypothetical protein